MADTRDLLVEIGTEELPPKSLRKLSRALGTEVCAGLDTAELSYANVALFATPRRLAVLLADVQAKQKDRALERRGPAVSAAFDTAGRPTKAAEGFARSCGVEVESLQRLETEKGAWVVHRATEPGKTVQELVPTVVETALRKLPVARRMRWADGDAEFVRPVHWVVLLFGETLIEAELLGVNSGRTTRGHRFHCPTPLYIDRPAEYENLLSERGYVVASFEKRAEHIKSSVSDTAQGLGGRAVIDDQLLEEVTALVEWPVAISGDFDTDFLALPSDVLVATMQAQQRYFPVIDDDGNLLPHFITISNIESSNPFAVKAGNERVIRPRLADAAFFYQSDLECPLAARLDDLAEVTFQEQLGSLRDRSNRLSKLASHVAIAMGEDPEQVKLVRRAGLLCKCDLVTKMVGEFPELQGVMGGAYAVKDGEPPDVGTAIAESYLPRFAGDRIPRSGIGRALAIADKLDTLVGIFGIGEHPTGDKDPYALRRAALGVLRILIEGELDLDITRLVDAAVEEYAKPLPNKAVAAEVLDFIHDRLRAYFADAQVPTTVFTAVQVIKPPQPLDFANRVYAVDKFRGLPEADSLAAANKRIRNILKQVEGEVPDTVDEQLFSEEAEWNLAAKMVGLTPRVHTLLKERDYATALALLAGLRDPVDEFFDNVMVMADDPAVRNNRLAMLNNISALFLATADISKLR